MRRIVSTLLTLLLLSPAACGPAGKSPTTAKPAPTAAIPPPPAAPAAIDPGYEGEQPPSALAQPVPARVAFSGSLGKLRVLSLTLPGDLVDRAHQELKLTPNGFDTQDGGGFYVHAPAARVAFGLLNDSDPTPAELRSSAGPPPSEHRLWFLLEEEAVSKLSADIYFYASATPVRATVAIPALPTSQASTSPTAAAPIARTWGRALRRHFSRSASPIEAAPFPTFARSQLATVYGDRGEQISIPSAGQTWDSDLAEWMSFSSGYASIEAALQQNAAPVAQLQGNPTVSLSKVSPPNLPRHEWALMLQQLRQSPVTLPLAAAVPAHFYLVHAASGDALFRALDEMDAWGTSALRFMEQRAYQGHVSEFYQTQLGIRRTEISRLLGPSVISELAWVGSDPFLRRGSDVTLIFRPKQTLLLKTGLEAALAQATQGVSTAKETLTLAGTSVTHVSSQDGAVSRYQAEHAGLVLISNSPKALEQVLLTLQQKAPALAQEADFQYMLARDQNSSKGPPDVLVYLGDAFIENVVAPATRILDARRGLAWTELRRVGYGALLGSYFGASPTPDAAALLAQRVLQPAHLRHFDKSVITVDGKGSPRSAWGTARFLTPLIDLPVPSLITQTEADAYQSFSQQYQFAWGENIDPIALRVWINQESGQLEAHLRVLPVVRVGEYDSILSIVGDQRVAPGMALPGGRLLLSLDENSDLRRELTTTTSGLLGRSKLLDWIGDYAYIGVMDAPELAEAARDTLAPRDPNNEEPPRHELDALAHTPLYAAIAVQSTTGAQLALTYLKTQFLKDVPSIKLETAEPYAGAVVSHLMLQEQGEQLDLYYALGKHALFFALQENVLHQLLDNEAAGKEPKGQPTAKSSNARGAPPKGASSTSSGDSAQFSATLSAAARGGMFYTLAWALEQEQAFDDVAARRQASWSAQVWGAGDASALERLQLKYWGEVPVTRDGLPFVQTEAGLADPNRGSDFYLKWPRIPVNGSDFERLLQRLASVSTTLSSDLEAPGSTADQRSLSIHLKVQKREP